MLNTPPLTFAVELAEYGGKVALEGFRQSHDIDNKDQSGFDPVTNFDRQAELAMRARILAQYPDHAVHGEEFEDSGDAQQGYRWVIDPIDGTRAYICGIPTWATLVALTYNGKICFGVAVFPALGETYYGDGQSATYRHATQEYSLSSSPVSELQRASLSATAPEIFSDSADKLAFARLDQACKLTRYGMDAYAYCLVAAGHIDVVAEASLKYVDWAALVPILQGAGALCCDWQGAPPSERTTNLLACANTALQTQALAQLG